MKVAIVGATGFVGNAVLNELLQKGHQVTAIVLNPNKLASKKGLSVVKGDINDVKDFGNKIAGNDAVISAFNAGWTNPNLYADFLKGSEAIQSGIKMAGIKRLIVVGGAGSLYIGDQQLVDSPQFPAEWRAGALAARDYLNILKDETELDWVFISPAMEMHPGTSGTRKGVYRTGGDNPVFDKDGRSVISVEDLAVAIVDELEGQKHSRERFTVAY
jgi:putative NADH-flavin reductase